MDEKEHKLPKPGMLPLPPGIMPKPNLPQPPQLGRPSMPPPFPGAQFPVQSYAAPAPQPRGAAPLAAGSDEPRPARDGATGPSGTVSVDFAELGPDPDSLAA